MLCGRRASRLDRSPNGWADLRANPIPAFALTAAPLAIWLTRPDAAESLSKDISPVSVELIIAAAAALLLKIYTGHRR